MKWIGQHIYDNISRFRDDVYLEDISAGTIASGGNLGLDSNNKIVKQSDTGITDLHGAGVDGSNNQLLTDDGDGTVTSEANLTFDGTDLSVTGDLFNINVVSTHTLLGYHGALQFKKDAADVADGEILGRISFYGDNDAGTPEQIEYAQVIGQVEDASDSDEAGKLSMYVTTSAGTTTGLQQALIATGHGANNTVDIGLGYGAASTTTVAGTLTMGSTATLNNTGILQTAPRYQTAFHTSSFHSSSTSGFYAPFNYIAESSSLSTASYFLMFSAPYDGRVLKVSTFTQSASSKTTTVEMYLNGDDSDLAADQVGTDLVISSYSNSNVGVCATDWVFSAGDALSFRITNSVAGSGQSLTFAVQYDLDT